MRLLFVPLILLSLATRAFGQWIEDPGFDATIKAGIRSTYNLDFGSAERAFQSVIHGQPDHPAGYFFKAMVEWWRIQIDIEDESRDDGFFRQLERILDLCDKRLDNDEKDVAALFFKGGSIGFRGRLYAIRKSWLKAAADGKDALPIVVDAARYAPRNADIDLGTGIYNYYAVILPDKYPILKPLMLFLPAGDRSKGIRQLRNAAENARYANWEAMFFLLQVYANYENKPTLALPYARRLNEEFPNNPLFHRYLGRVYVKLGNWEQAAKVFRVIQERCQQSLLGYTENHEREASYYLGYEAMIRKEYGAAMKHLVRCDELSRSIDKDGPSGFMVMANLRMGQVHDLLYQREYATRQYDKVLAMKEYFGSHGFARQYKRTPFSF